MRDWKVDVLGCCGRLLGLLKRVLSYGRLKLCGLTMKLPLALTGLVENPLPFGGDWAMPYEVRAICARSTSAGDIGVLRKHVASRPM